MLDKFGIKTKVVVISLVLMGAVIGLVAQSGVAHAVLRPPLNVEESAAFTDCTAGNGGRSGAIWFNDGTGSYYDDTVTVGSNATFVTVYIRGSVNGCGWDGSGDTYAGGVASAAPNAGRLNITGGNELYRGHLSNGSSAGGVYNNWSTQGGSLTAQLDVRGLATNNQTGDAKQTIKIGVFRYLLMRNPYFIGGYGTAIIPVTVIRKAQPQWSISPSSSVNKSTASPGDTVKFTHNLTVKTNSTTSPVNWTVSKSYAGASWSNLTTGTMAKGAGIGAHGVGANDFTIPSNAAIGSKYCQRVSANPVNAGGGTATSTQACVTIVASWRITPISDANPSVVYAGQSVTFTHSLKVNGGPTNKPAAWKITGFGITPTTPQTTGSLASGKTTNTYPTSSTPFTYPVLSTTPIGSTICQRLDVNPVSWDGNPSSDHSEACATVVLPPVKPMVQIEGYDARVGGKVSTSLTLQGGNTFGSWSEYGVLSGSNNYNFASSRGLDGGNPSANQSDWSRLTFANSGNPCGAGTFGCYTGLSYPDNLVKALRSRCGTAATPWQNGTAASPYPIQPAASYSGTNFICVNGTAKIASNVVTDGDASLVNPSSIPQVVIIADNIIIDPSVTTIDAWLVAGTKTDLGDSRKGNISTCLSVYTGSGASINYFPGFNGINLGTKPGSASCPNPLTVTGPVIANRLYLYRTTDPTAAGNPAETFNLRADAFLWAYGGGGTNGTPYAQTTSVRELPPRF